MEYVRSEHVQLTSKSPSFTTGVQRVRSSSSGHQSSGHGLDEETRMFFSLMAEGNIDSLRELLEEAQTEKSSLKSLFCHPLCDCKKCSALTVK